MKIIIVEDEKSIRNGLVKMLPKLDPEYEVVGSAKDGLEGYQQILAEQPDLVIMDISIRQGMLIRRNPWLMAFSTKGCKRSL